MCSNLITLCTFLIIVHFTGASTQSKCPEGGEIFFSGMSDESKKAALNVHNKYRKMIAGGEVTGQPKGVNLKRMEWDDELSLKAHVVSASCKKDHIQAKDTRFPWVGQNIYTQCGNRKNLTPDWERAMIAWFREHEYFTYPNHPKGGHPTGHYTQVVWAESNLVGCDFVAFFNVSKPKMPYTRLYTCNYGPGGNLKGRAPYETGSDDGCRNLC